MSSLSRISEKCRPPPNPPPPPNLPPPPNPPPPRLKPEGERGVVVCERLTLACCCPLVRGWRGLYVGSRRPVISCPLVDEREVVVCERLVVPCPLCVADALEFGLVVWPVDGLAPLDAGWLELGWLAVLFCRSVIEAFGAHGAGGPTVEEVPELGAVDLNLIAGCASSGIGVEAKGTGADTAALGGGAADVVPLAVEAFGAHGAGGPAVEEVLGAVDLNLIAGCATSGIGVEANGTGADTTALGGGAADVVALAVEAFGAHGAGGPAVEEAGWVLAIAGVPGFGATSGGIGVETKGAGDDIAALGRGVAAAAVADRCRCSMRS